MHSKETIETKGLYFTMKCAFKNLPATESAFTNCSTKILGIQDATQMMQYVTEHHTIQTNKQKTSFTLA